jgi:hypothetical protein
MFGETRIRNVYLLAGEYLPLARFFDWLDVRLRRLKRWIKGRWNRLPASVKSLVVLAFVAALGYGTYYLLFGS